MGARPWLAHTYHDYARLSLARETPDGRAQAQRLLVGAIELYEALGMAPWLAQASELFAAT
jgi:hypothetical protein